MCFICLLDVVCCDACLLVCGTERLVFGSCPNTTFRIEVSRQVPLRAFIGQEKIPEMKIPIHDLGIIAWTEYVVPYTQKSPLSSLPST